MSSSQRPGSGSPSSSGSSAGGSPLDQGPGAAREKEASAAQPGGDGEPPGSRGSPSGPGDSSEPPRNEPGGPPPKLATGRAGSPEGNQAWGDLPPQVREVFTGAGSSDLPPRYRDWIDAYHRRLNRQP